MTSFLLLLVQFFVSKAQGDYGNVSGESPSVMVTQNMSMVGVVDCSAIIEFTCEAKHVTHLQWLLGPLLLANYSYEPGDVFPLILPTSEDYPSVNMNILNASVVGNHSLHITSTLTSVLSVLPQEDTLTCGSVQEDIVNTATLNYQCRERCQALKHISERVQRFCDINHPTHTCSQVWKDMNTGCAMIAVIALVLVILVIALVAACCCFCFRRKWKKRVSLQEDSRVKLLDPPLGRDETLLELRNADRLANDQTERTDANELAKSLWRYSGYEYRRNLPDIGRRLQKYWYLLEKEGEKYLQIIVRCCTDPQIMKVIKELFDGLQHPYLLTITDMTYDESASLVSLIQPLVKKGSIRDMLFDVEFTNDWGNKYSEQESSRPFSSKEIARCGRHILKAVLFLYEVGFPPLGHIQSGNIFLTDKGYVLGGYENTLLGYKAHRFSEIEREGLLIDVLMFGHVILEMASGSIYSAKNMVPAEAEYEKMIEDANIRKVLTYIIDSSKYKWNNHKNIISKILKQDFFQQGSFHEAQQRNYYAPSEPVKKLLKGIRNGKLQAHTPIGLAQYGTTSIV